jgi:lysophospholipase L1-like esterase
VLRFGRLFEPLFGRPFAGGIDAPRAGGGGGVDLTNVFNLTATSGAKIATAINRARTGGGIGRILCQGDSTIFGYGSNFGQNFAAYLRQALVAKGVPARFNSWIGTGSSITNADYLQYDGRLSFLSTTAVCSTFAPTVIGATENVFGGSWVGLSTDGITFTPSNQFDRVIATYQTLSGSFGTGAVVVSGADLANTINANVGGSLGLGVTQNNCTLGVHPVTVRRTNASGLRLTSLITWDSAASYVDILQAGVPSSRIAFHNDGAFGSSPRNATMFDLLRTTGTPGAVPVDFVILCLTINDSNGGTSVATWSTAMQSLITAYQTRGLQVVLLIGPPSNTTQATNGTLDAYITEAKVIALAKDCPLFDLKARWGSYAASVSKYADNLHPNATGYEDEGGWVANTLADFAMAA